MRRKRQNRGTRTILHETSQKKKRKAKRQRTYVRTRVPRLDVAGPGHRAEPLHPGCKSAVDGEEALSFLEGLECERLGVVPPSTSEEQCERLGVVTL